MPKYKNTDALDYHSQGRPGKIEVVPTKPYSSQRDLSLAYSPGVAEPCKIIHQSKDEVYNFTAKGNLVAVITNGTAVLGLGNIGPEASKPVMEGKGLLFKIFADIDVFDLEIAETDPDKFVDIVKALSPTFGGINLEDIAAPECFEIEKRLREELDIPVMHDDQHGTAIITSAALLNALILADKQIEDVKVVVNGAGASAVSCTRQFMTLGVLKDNIVMLDSKGVLRRDKEYTDVNKRYFATARNINTLAEAMKDADVFLGLSIGNVVTKEMLQSMAPDPIVFALANPDPEISYRKAAAARKDAIIATGRSDHHNQVNNVLGFPYIFRGALDVRAKRINEAMKLAAINALALLARQPVPEIVNLAYNTRNMAFGRDYIIPKPFDPRLITEVAPAVARAAMDSDVARIHITDWEAYTFELEKRLGNDNKLMSVMTNKAKQNPKKVIFAEADNYNILKAAQMVRDDGIALPILLGEVDIIRKLIKENKLDLGDTPIIDPRSPSEDIRRGEFAQKFFEKRKRRGYNLYEAQKRMEIRNYFGAMMVETGHADALISGLTRKYADTIRPSLKIIGTEEGNGIVAGMYIMMTKRGPVFFADTTVNINPTADDLVKITLLAARAVKEYNIQPRIALVSFSNFGSSETEETIKVREAVAYLHKHHPEIIVDGEVQANFALNKKMMREQFPFSPLAEKSANTLIFPNLAAGNICYKMLQELEMAEAIGPILLGMKKSVHVLQLGSTVREIVNMVTIAVTDAQAKD